ncbi:hypothetical protein HT121_10380 [Pseudomonas sp. MAFF 301514]|uniref:hypothetical protein n=1 Tax=Pseudomonas allii TaxID=2740531 RepID=UPI0015BD83E6|nr:hypothetical protein [Pseudomonas allii]NWN48003.1 hypothetical protein [Pseudomonas allii]
MIYESSNWKLPLVRAARWLEKTRVTDVTETRVLARAEREVFIGFYAVRKLLETFNLSDSTRSLAWKLTCYRPKPGRIVDHLNRGDIFKNYELGNKLSETRDLGFVCNQVIHSFVFELALGESDALDGVFLTSDQKRANRLYYIPMSLIIDVFRMVGLDYPSELHLARDLKTRQWKGAAS